MVVNCARRGATLDQAELIRFVTEIVALLAAVCVLLLLGPVD